VIRFAPLLATAALAFATPALAGTDVPLAHFSGVGLNGGGHVVVKYGAQQRVTLLKGSTEFTGFKVEHGSLKIDTCNRWLHCPSHYDLEVEIVTPDLDALAVNGGGEIESANGFPKLDQLNVAVNGGGEINLRNITVGQVNAAVHGGGEIDVTAQRSLNAAVVGGGEITYWGNPQVAMSTVGGGDISKGS
jgi:hypothetical protein